MKRIRHVWTDAHGIETVQWIAWGGVLLILIAVVYGVFDGNAQLRAAIRNTTAFLAVRFGSDIGARGPRGTAPCWMLPSPSSAAGQWRRRQPFGRSSSTRALRRMSPSRRWGAC